MKVEGFFAKRISRFITNAVLTLVCVSTFVARGAAVTLYGNITFSYTVADGKACITDIAFKNGLDGWFELPSQINGYPVTRVTATIIRSSHNISTVVIPEGVEEIGPGACSFLSKATHLYLPTSLKVVGTGAFGNRSKLERVIIDDLSAWSQINFGDSLANPLSPMSAIGYSSCGLYLRDKTYMIQGSYKQTLVTELNNLAGIVRIGDNAYAGYSSLKSVVIPESCIQIGQSAFKGCSALESATGGAGLTSIGDSAFQACANLSTANLLSGANVASIGASAFNGCTRLSEVSISSGVRTIGAYALYGSGLNSLVVPYGVENIGEYAFSECGNMSYLVIPNSVQAIGQYVTWGCGRLQSIIAPHRFRSLFLMCSPSAWYSYGDTVISLDANGGSVSPSALTLDKGAVFVIPEPQKAHHVFAGWWTQLEGGEKVVSGIASEDMTLYAHWDAVQHVVLFDANGGQCSETLRTCKEAEVIGELPSATWEDDYRFDGWFTEKIGGTKIEANSFITTDMTLYAHWTDVLETVSSPMFSPEHGSEFHTSKCRVTISCNTQNAVIYYSTNGTPRMIEDYEYTGPFEIESSTTITAVAVKRGHRSEYSRATIIKNPIPLSEAVEGTPLLFTTGGEANWVVVDDVAAVGKYSVCSGRIEANQSSWIATEVNGAGVLTFQWKVSCEKDDAGVCAWDRIVLTTNGVECVRMDGVVGWNSRTITFRESGTHTVRWTYLKDGYDADGADYADCAWLDNVRWTPSDPMPQLDDGASAIDVANALDGSADPALSRNIVDAKTYNAYRTWARNLESKGVTLQMVKEAPNAWLSFALDADKLIDPKQGDLKIGNLMTSSDGTIEMTCELDGVEIGPAAENYIRQVFDIVGASSLNESKFSGENIAFELKRTSSGKVKATIVPKDSLPTFFMKVRMK